MTYKVLGNKFSCHVLLILVITLITVSCNRAPYQLLHSHQNDYHYSLETVIDSEEISADNVEAQMVESSVNRNPETSILFSDLKSNSTAIPNRQKSFKGTTERIEVKEIIHNHKQIIKQKIITSIKTEKFKKHIFPIYSPGDWELAYIVALAATILFLMVFILFLGAPVWAGILLALPVYLIVFLLGVYIIEF